jgi:hypothetical protein
MRKYDAEALQDDCNALIAAAMGQIPDDEDIYIDLALLVNGLQI